MFFNPTPPVLWNMQLFMKPFQTRSDGPCHRETLIIDSNLIGVVDAIIGIVVRHKIVSRTPVAGAQACAFLSKDRFEV